MSDSSFNLTSDEREQLVAYLDGELPENDCAAVEDRLTADVDFRDEMQRLARAWDALDELPHMTAGDAFTKTTIEMVTVAAEEEFSAETSSVGRQQTRQTWWTVGLLAAAVVVGFLICRWSWPNPNRQLIADLPVIERLDVYTQIPDVDFLHLLSKSMDGRMDQLSEMELQTAYDDIMAVSDASYGARRLRIDDLDPNAEELLAIHFARFRDLSDDIRQRLRRLHRKIVDAPDAAKLIDTMTHYMAWLENRSAGDRAELRGLPAEKRIARIEQMIERERRGKRQLSEADYKALRQIMKDYLDKLKQERIQKAKTPHDREQLQKLTGRQLARWQWVFVFQLLRQQTPEAQEKWRALYDQAFNALSEESQQYLKGLSTDKARHETLGRWIHESFRRMRDRPVVTFQALEAFFAGDALSNDQKERLLAMPRDRMVRELQQEYYQKEYGGGWFSPGRNGRPPRGGRSGDGPPTMRGGRGPRGDGNGAGPPGGPPRGPDFRGRRVPSPDKRPPENGP